MNDHRSPDPAGCRKFERNLYHFQAEELSEVESRELTRHAEACTACAERMALEEAFLSGLRRRLTRTSPPDGLRERVREALHEEARPATFATALRVPWLIPAAASLLLALLLIPVLSTGGGAPELLHVERDVTVVDRACDRAGASVTQQRSCRDPRHLNALKIGPDEYWDVSLDQEASRRLVVDREMRGHRLHVEGELYARIRTLQLTAFTDQGLDELSAHRRPTPGLILAALPER